ncbi:MAG TPA: GTPase, partial [Phenylobacterium sp.]|nr:GTPase [Phenylobacterium sp.]
MTTRAGFAAIIGAPNAGKSTLTNRLVGAKVSIVTQKVQTTRFPVRGVAMAGDAQIVLVDTPGIFQPRRRLDRAMIRAAWGGARDADVIVHLVDSVAELAAEGPNGKAADRKAAIDVESIVEGLKAANKT